MFSSGVELTTGLTDVLIAIFSIFVLFKLNSLDMGNKYRKLNWKLFFIVLSVAGTMGFFIHGLTFSKEVVDILWFILSFVFCIIMTNLLIVSLYEYDEKLNRKYLYYCIGFSIMTFILMVIFAIKNMDFLNLYIIFVSIIGLISTSIFCIMYFKYKKKNNLYFILAMMVQLLGGIVLFLKSFYIKLFLEYDYNSFYHICLLVTIVLFYIGNKKRINN